MSNFESRIESQLSKLQLSRLVSYLDTETSLVEIAMTQLFINIQ